MITANASDSQIVRSLIEVKHDAPRDANVAAELARVLADSGENFDPKTPDTADVASTGGPSSLSTLLCPLFLKAAGFVVPKLGVPGRPAGGIDCLAQIDGYRVNFDATSLRQALDNAGYAHFLASGRFAPLDARVFVLRQQNACQDVPTLVAASLLSKKLAVGVRHAGLDVRAAPHGNFGKDMAEAALNAALFADTAHLLGLKGYPVVSNATLPYQPFIGRGEALWALRQIFEGEALPWLDEHLQHCRSLSASAIGVSESALFSITRSSLKEAFLLNVIAQGGSEQGFVKLVDRVTAGHIHFLEAKRPGVVVIDLAAVRTALVDAQSAVPSGVLFADPAGVVLKRRPGDRVEQGEVLATVRLDCSLSADNVLRQLERCIRSAPMQADGKGEE